jgi:hypothetical protein
MSAPPELDWDLFLSDVDDASAPPGLPAAQRLYARACTARALWIFRRHGWPAAQAHVRRPRRHRLRHGVLPPETAVRLARRQIFWCQLVVRALAPRANCLPRSLALLAHLSALGLPARLCLGRAIASTSAADRFHAWTELHGTVLNDYQNVTAGYTVLHRVFVPEEPA